jgi:hypothetical protein
VHGVDRGEDLVATRSHPGGQALAHQPMTLGDQRRVPGDTRGGEMKTAKVKPPSVEEWASKVVAAELGTPVAVHDDGSQQSMYDLRVGPPDAPHMAIEVAGAVDPVQTATWNTGPAKGPLQLALKGDWIVTLAPSAKMKIVRRVLEGVLQQMEAIGLSEADRQFDEEVSPAGLQDQMNAIDVVSANRFREAGSGKVHMTIPGTGGAVDSAGTSVPDWVGTFLAHPSRADVVSKLKNSGAPKAEAFIAVESGAPWSVISYLSGSVTKLPHTPPILPSGVTGVWVCPTQWYYGVYWDGATWRRVKLPTATTTPAHPEPNG